MNTISSSQALSSRSSPLKNRHVPAREATQSQDSVTLSSSPAPEQQTLAPALKADKPTTQILSGVLGPIPMEMQAKQAVERVAIVGSGPAGLATAIKLAQRGIKVTLLEARDQKFQRPIHVNLRDSTLHELRVLGVYAEVMAKSGWEPEDSATLGWEAGPSDPRAILTSKSRTSVRMSDLETALYHRALELGVEFRSHTTGKLEKSGAGFDVTAQPVDIDDATSALNSLPGQKMVGNDLVLVTDGANSRTREGLGISFDTESGATYFVGALVDYPLGPKVVQEVHDVDGFRQHVMLTGHHRYPQTWALIEVDPTHRDLQGQESIKYFCQQMSETVKHTIDPSQIVWGARALSKVQNRRAHSNVAGDNVVMAGDASRAGFAWSSGGVNLALCRDVAGVVKLVEALNGGADRQAALAEYEATVQETSTAWLEHGAHEFSDLQRAQA